MVEIHEPTRLAIVVEAPPERVSRVLRDDPAIEQLVRNRWIWIACLDPDSGALSEWRPTGFARHVTEHALPVVTGESSNWYQGKSGFLAPVAIAPSPSA
jgi:hypothetical protein